MTLHVKDLENIAGLSLVRWRLAGYAGARGNFDV
jgi:hypothetical protein